LADWLYYNSRLTLTVHPALDVFRRPGERERSFKARLRQAARERRDAEVDRLTEKYETRIARLEARLRKEERDLVTEEADYEARKREERITMGETVLSFFMGRRRTRAVSTVARKQRLSDKAKLRIARTRQEIVELEEEIAALEEELGAAAQEITREWADLLDELTTEELHPRRTDVDVRLVALAWLPSWQITYHDGVRTRTATLAAYASLKQ
jgi:chromosome segregation ATPase